MNKTITRASALGLGIAVTAVLAGCSASASTEESAASVRSVMSDVEYDCDAPNADTTTKISVTALPITSNGALYAGIDQGFFTDNGLDVEVSTVSGLPATIAAVQGGATDFAFTGTIATFQAIDQGIPLAIVSPFAGIAPGYWDKMQAGEEGYTREINALLVAPDSGIDDPGDLSGKTVAIGDVKGQSELTTRYVIDKHGGDSDSVNFTVMAFADAVNALMAGQVDAAYSAEPAMTVAEQAGYKIISWPGVETLQEGPTSAMISSSDYVMKNPETVARFNCAIRASTAFGNANPDIVRSTIAREQGVDPATLANAVVPYYYESVDLSGLQRFADLETEAGFISQTLDTEALVIPQALK